jgi:hypothetical protein
VGPFWDSKVSLSFRAYTRNWTGRIVEPEQDRQKGKGRMGQAERIARTGQTEQDRQNRTGRMGQVEQNRQTGKIDGNT